MIKIFGDTYYMTMGEACYIARGDKHVAFGARIEPEDDVSALFGARGFKEIEDGDVVLSRDGKPVTPQFALVEAKVEQKQPTADLPILRGEQTLEVTLCDSRAGVELKLYYTPYVRGGIARRAVLKNLSGGDISVERLLCGVPTGGAKIEKCADGLVAAVGSGGAIGAFTLYAGETEIDTAGGRIACGAKCAVDLHPCESFYTPETLFVYSDGGVGGLVRAYHDILREFGMPSERRERRMSVVVYCPTDGDAQKCETRVQAVAALGADAVVVDADGDVLRRYIAAVKKHGMTAGLKARFDDADVLKKAEKAGAEYIEIDCGGLKTYEQAQKAYALYRSLRELLPDADVEFFHPRASAADVKTALKQIARSPVPACLLRNVVKIEKTSLKTAFDVASFGALGYSFDPAQLSDGVRRAVRAQVLSYRDDADTVKTGDVYDAGGGIAVVSKDKSRAYAATAGAAIFNGLDVHNLYNVREIGKTFSGAALGFYGLSGAAGDTVTYHIRQVADYE